MKELKYILLLIFHLLIVSCERQEKIRTDHIIIGNTFNLIVDSHDKVVVGDYPVPGIYEIDLDLDGVFDYKLKSYVDKFFPGGYLPGADIECLHKDAYFFTNIVRDTIYFTGHDTTIQNEGDTTYVRYYDQYDCFNISGNDSIVSIRDIEVVKEVPVGKEIKNTDYFTTDTLILNQPSYETEYKRLYVSQDTVFYNVKSYYCTKKHRIGKDKVIYIGLKVKGKLGWLRMSVLDSYDLVIFETAIQK